jgi:dTDP-4-amino-4,6-dideoxygalactose transaminase
VASPDIRVRYVDFPAQYREEKPKILEIVEDVFGKGQFVDTPQVKAFEDAFASYCGVGHAVGVANGTDAIALVLRALDIGPGDEVITAPNSFFASAGGIRQAGATPVFADVGKDMNIDPAKVEAAITPRTRAILPVHLAGLCCDMDAINAIAERRGLAVIEDAAQSAGATYRKRKAGSLGRAACFSFHPLKNLNAAGDAGGITTNDEALAERIRRLRNHGMRERNYVLEWGLNSRLDALQAALLTHRLSRLDEVIAKRRRNAERYRRLLPEFETPRDSAHGIHSHHLFVIQVDRRDELKAALLAAGIETAVHYPVPIHWQKALDPEQAHRKAFPETERQAGRILSLPIHQFLRDDQIDLVAAEIRRFHGRPA